MQLFIHLPKYKIKVENISFCQKSFAQKWEIVWKIEIFQRIDLTKFRQRAKLIFGQTFDFWPKCCQK